MSLDSDYSVAVVEDEMHLNNDLVDFLKFKGVNAVGFTSAESLYKQWPKQHFDLAIIDIGLPGDNGLQLMQWLHLQTNSIGIILLTSLDQDADQIKGLSEGADAYLIKNVSLDVIFATCQSVVRRTLSTKNARQPLATELNNTWQLSTSTWHLSTPDQQTLKLTFSEFFFLRQLMLNPSKPVSRLELLRSLDKEDTLSNRRNLDNYANRLRRKLRNDCNLKLPVYPTYGSGYAFMASAKVIE